MEYQHPQENSEEQVEQNLAVEAAQEKLEILTNPEYKDFGIRFANLEEYRQIAKGKRIPKAEEVYVPRYYKGTHPRSFTEYLRQSAEQGWLQVAFEQTNWELSLMNIQTYNLLIKFLKNARTQAKNNPSSERRKDVVKLFRNNILEFANIDGNGYNRDRHISGVIEAILKDKPHLDELKQQLLQVAGKTTTEQFLSEFEKPVHGGATSTIRPLIKKGPRNIEKITELEEEIYPIQRVMTALDSERIRILEEFLTGKNESDNPEYLRQIIRALAYSPVPDAVGNPLGRQYHVAMIVNLDSVSDTTSYSKPEWRYTNGEERNLSLLGAIAVIPDKQLVQEMQQLSRSSELFSHPIFSNNGNIAYPKFIKP